MPQQALTGPGDDWTGISNPKERKKIQDRIHQRISHGPLDLSLFTACEPDSERTEWFIIQFTTDAHQTFLHVMNARVMGITQDIMVPGSRSQLTSKDGDIAAHNSLPLSLRPTHLQLTISHHPWIDILPFPEIRDNLLRHDENSYCKKELCRDLRGFQAVADGCGGIIAWGDPWDSRGWEVTEAFASKWPWVVKGCHKLLESTNYWRAVRDEQTGCDG
ncbi:hypothetical protein BKA56DRAFT_631816 [Ilyonectria sp. MPI-CAGE-AT-0026]|nr:hypothetical protein BKA56DRAFT_631816 [Ilyonectria sp. MPI-CAGE-AT-0026]